jgi:hypothetical protein
VVQEAIEGLRALDRETDQQTGPALRS